MICHEESLTVNPEKCLYYPCKESCKLEECQTCWHCMSQNQKYDLHLSYRETKHRGSMKRVFPPSKVEHNLI